MKLELKHLAPYLPYKLKITFEGDEHEHELIGLDITSNGVKLLSPFNDYGSSSLEASKPLLHPLSRLTEPILKDDNTPIDYFQETYYTLSLDSQCKRILEDERWINQCDWLLMQYLFEWHFDVFGLIEKGLAEPIETFKAKGE